ncbi:MAG: radical SAM family heme chaperone HemW [Peptococcaceae bacterium]|nr:radical SAM family heme chaperone HemW [Peptococcaceae bacterium]
MGLAVYIHIPFCERKCNYCDFPSYPAAAYDIDAYLRALELELLRRSSDVRKSISSLFVGGGTPSILQESQLTVLFGMVQANFGLEPDAEVSIEANPGSCSAGKFALLRELGVNRLSLGVQSLQSDLLRRLGRCHTPAEAIEAVHLARDAGFDNINLDFIAGVPGQDLAAWQATLQTALELQPEHLSLYGLSIEPNTPFGSQWADGCLEVPDDEAQATMLEWSQHFLAEQGYGHYEISNYALPGKACRHNQVYWRNLPYLGFGAGAASYWQEQRSTNLARVEEYVAAVNLGVVPVAEKEHLSVELQMAETLFLGLRLLAGVEKRDFARRFNLNIDDVYGEKIKVLQNKGLLEDSGKVVKLSKRGILLANEVFCEFLP